MALPGAAAKKLGASMADAGLASMPPDDEGAPETGDEEKPADDARAIPDILDDMDKLVPGLGDLCHELVERMKEDDEEQDEKDMGG